MNTNEHEANGKGDLFLTPLRSLRSLRLNIETPQRPLRPLRLNILKPLCVPCVLCG